MSIRKHYENGTMKEIFKSGGISINVMTYGRYNQVFEAYRAKGLSKNKSYDNAADECGCSRRTIIRAVAFVNR